jgi:hypothetical protein
VAALTSTPTTLDASKERAVTMSKPPPEPPVRPVVAGHPFAYPIQYIKPKG